MKIHRDSGDIEKIRRTNFFALSFTALFYGFGQSMFYIVYIPFLFDFTDSIFIIGVMTTLGSVIQFLPAPWIGRLSDRYGRKLIWYFDTPFMILGLLMFILARNLIIITTGILSFNFGLVIAISTYQVFISENSKEGKKGFNYGILGFLMTVGETVGSIFVLVDSRFDVRLYFFLFIVILVINQIIFIFFIFDPIPKKSKHLSNPSKSSKTDKKFWRKMLATPKTRRIVFYFTLDAFIYSISFSIYNAGIIDQYSITQQNIALLALCSKISWLLFQIPAGHLADKLGNKKTIILSELFGLSFFILITMTYFIWSGGLQFLLLPLLITGEIIMAVNVTTFIPSEAITLTNLNETRRAESYGIVWLIRGIGVMPTGIIAGLLIAGVHYIIPFIFTIMGIIFKLWFLFNYFEDNKKKSSENNE
ncbi:MAG: MFS transporter [Promethearchaeota archaeon]|jgi:MFS family permease